MSEARVTVPGKETTSRAGSGRGVTRIVHRLWPEGRGVLRGRVGSRDGCADRRHQHSQPFDPCIGLRSGDTPGAAKGFSGFKFHDNIEPAIRSVRDPIFYILRHRSCSEVPHLAGHSGAARAARSLVGIAHRSRRRIPFTVTRHSSLGLGEHRRSSRPGREDLRDPLTSSLTPPIRSERGPTLGPPRTIPHLQG